MEIIHHLWSICNCSSLVSNIFIGITSGLVVAEVYRKATFNRSKQVKVTICNYLIKRYNKKQIPVLQAKIKNESSKDLAEIEVKIFGIKYYDSEKYHQNRTLLSQKYLDFLPKYDKNDKKCNYFYVPSLYSCSFNIHEEIKYYDDILILFKAIDYYDNNIVITEKIIEKQNIKDNYWHFENCSCSTSKRDDIKNPDNINIPMNEILENCPFLK